MGMLGAHISIAGGPELAIDRGEQIGCQAIQIFSKNQRQWRERVLSDATITRFQKRFRQSAIQYVVVHDSYLINLANPDQEQLNRSIIAFQHEIKRAEQLGAQYLVFHPGSHMDSGEQAGIKRIAESLNRIFNGMQETLITLLLETTAGQGTSLGYTFSQLRDIIGLSECQDRLGICVDTSHIFAAGYDFRTNNDYERLLQNIDDELGLNRVKVFHLNDSKTELGSRVDRHASVGKGKIGIDPFRYLVNDARFLNCPMILETPGGPQQYKKDLSKLRSLISKEGDRVG